ncbi:MAG: hypothetical protein M9938_04770 [Solirubrobacterales bacterium]|nr:hypothetical protein [Solirubrobacterales bacterium]
MGDLEARSLAELHKLADRAGIEKFRTLRREELIKRLGDSDGDGAEREAAGDGPDSGPDSGRSRSRRSRRSRRRRSDREGSTGEDRERGGETGEKHKQSADEGRSEDASTEPELTEITGVLDILPRGSGVIRGEGAPEAGIHVSPAQIRRCELRAGDEVSGPVRPARRGERRPSLVRVEKVNGGEPSDDRQPRFDSLTPVTPHRPIPLAIEGEDVLARATDLLVPLAFGQRILVQAQQRSGRTTLLRALAKAIAAGGAETRVSVLLVDERPEEVTAWNREVPQAEISAAPADLGAHEQVKLAQRTLTRAKRQAEAGEDVVLIIDSLTRLGSAFGDAGSVKPFFGVGRELEEEGAGSVTVIATALLGAPGDQDVLYAVHTSETATMRLDAALAASGITPAFDLAGCVVTVRSQIHDEGGLEAIGRLRAELEQLDGAAAASRLAELVRGTSSNEELRSRL